MSYIDGEQSGHNYPQPCDFMSMGQAVIQVQTSQPT